MIRPSQMNASVNSLIAVMALSCGAAQAQEKPFKITGAGVAPEGLPLPGQDPRSHWSVGVATHLGLYYGNGTVKTDSAAPDPATGKIAGEFGSGSPYGFRGANGDNLVCYYGRTDKGATDPGEFQITVLDVQLDGSLVVEAFFIAEFVVQPTLSTGKFAGATGSWVMSAQTGPFVLGSNDPLAYSWEGQGTLTFKKGK
jgi:hypothetical protein